MFMKKTQSIPIVSGTKNVLPVSGTKNFKRKFINEPGLYSQLFRKNWKQQRNLKIGFSTMSFTQSENTVITNFLIIPITIALK